MSDSPNVSVVRRLYQARGKPEVIRQVLARDVRWEVVDGFPYGGVYVGLDSVLRDFFGRLFEDFDDFVANGSEFFESGHRVIALGSYSGRARRSGRRFTARFAHVWTGPDGKVSLLDLFDGRRQLIVYHFMYHADRDRFCDGCSFFMDQVGHLAHLHARNTSFVAVSRAPLERIEQHKERLGWTVPFYSSWNSDFNQDFGLTTDEGEIFGLSVFFRDDDDNIYRSYFTDSRGIEALGSVWTFLDLTPWGRQKTWEDSPEGWPQTPPMNGGGFMTSTPINSQGEMACRKYSPFCGSTAMPRKRSILTCPLSRTPK